MTMMMMVMMTMMMMMMMMKGNMRVAEQIECGWLERLLHKLARLFTYDDHDHDDDDEEENDDHDDHDDDEENDDDDDDPIRRKWWWFKSGGYDKLFLLTENIEPLKHMVQLNAGCQDEFFQRSLVSASKLKSSFLVRQHNPPFGVKASLFLGENDEHDQD